MLQFFYLMFDKTAVQQTSVVPQGCPALQIRQMKGNCHSIIIMSFISENLKIVMQKFITPLVMNHIAIIVSVKKLQ